MASRIVLLVIAAVVARYSVPLAIGIGILSAVLPWIAVVMANDGPPKKSAQHRRAAPQAERSLSDVAGAFQDRRVITADSVIIDEHGATLRTKE